jgi:transposase
MISLKQVLVNAPGEVREQLEPLTKMILIRRCAGLRPGPITDPLAAAKHTLRAIARRWLPLDAEGHEQILGRLTTQLVPNLVAAFGIGADIAAEMLIVAGDNPERVIRSCVRQAVWRRADPGVLEHDNQAPAQPWRSPTSQRCPIPDSHRPAAASQTNANIFARRSAEGKTKAEIIRCLKRLLAREIWAHLRPLRQARQHLELAA